MRRDLISAYAVTAARIGSWVAVSAVVYRRLGAEALGLLTLVRATIGILSYTSLGLGPAIVKLLTATSDPSPGDADPKPPTPPPPFTPPTPSAAIPSSAVNSDAEAKPLIAYAARAPADASPDESISRVYSTGERLAVALGLLGLILTVVYAKFFTSLHEVPGEFAEAAPILVAAFGIGTVLRLVSDAPSGLLQARDRIMIDNLLLAGAEAAWGVLAVTGMFSTAIPSAALSTVGITFLAVNGGLLIARSIAGRMEVRQLTTARARPQLWIARQLLAFGILVVIAQVADFLYAPTDCILINRLLDPRDVAYYSPAIQIDAGLLLLVSGLAAVLYPKSSLAHAAGDVDRVRRYYRRGTLASISMLTAAAAAVWMIAPQLFRLWFHDDMPITRAILPLLLIHTVIGGSSAVGRSVLLAVGKVTPFTVAVLIAGVSNVILSYVFVRYGRLGLQGIVLGTIVVVVARCAIWMPWYITRTLRQISTSTSRSV
jgi:O-antigen/teichoic acid export membrane protein